MQLWQKQRRQQRRFFDCQKVRAKETGKSRWGPHQHSSVRCINQKKKNEDCRIVWFVRRNATLSKRRRRRIHRFRLLFSLNACGGFEGQRRAGQTRKLITVLRVCVGYTLRHTTPPSSAHFLDVTKKKNLSSSGNLYYFSSFTRKRFPFSL